MKTTAKCVSFKLQGPEKIPSVVEEEQTYTVESAQVLYMIGTPVVLHGLEKAVHLIGAFGDVRDYCVKNYRYVVRLEGKGRKPESKSNMRICESSLNYQICRIWTEMNWSTFILYVQVRINSLYFFTQHHLIVVNILMILSPSDTDFTLIQHPSCPE